MTETVACPIQNESNSLETPVDWLAALSAGHQPELDVQAEVQVS